MRKRRDSTSTIDQIASVPSALPFSFFILVHPFSLSFSSFISFFIPHIHLLSAALTALAAACKAVSAPLFQA